MSMPIQLCASQTKFNNAMAIPLKLAHDSEQIKIKGMMQIIEISIVNDSCAKKGILIKLETNERIVARLIILAEKASLKVIEKLFVCCLISWV